ncbi:MAG: prolipoprotein diacylglyceryl transferase [Clostridia bacterium]|nr:prolipoprotein diacylglyceryl transferase [Clostridia bacterium]
MGENEVLIFGMHFNINPVAFVLPIGQNGWKIQWYGVLIAFGFLLAVIYGARYAKRFNIDFDRLLDVIIVTAPVAILCARAYYVIFDGKPLKSFGEFFGVGTDSGISGLAIYGGVIGAAVCGTLMCRLKKIKVLDALDLAALGFLIGQGIGRWGNFTNQEAFGTFTGSSFWGMQSNNTIDYMKGYGLVHPCFLYESIWCIAGFFVLHFLANRRKFSGQISLYYCVWYGFGRAIIETLRTDSLMIGPIRVSCLLSAVACVAAAVALVLIDKRMKEEKAALVYSGVFSDDETEEEAEEEPTEETNEESEADIKEEENE